MRNGEIDAILRMLDQAFDRRSWHGTNLRGAIRGLSAADAAWRPEPQRHNTWEIVVHAAYWKYTVRRRLLGERRGSFPLKGSNWFARPAAGRDLEAGWHDDVALLVSAHRSLREAVASLHPRVLYRAAPGGKTPIVDLLTGIAAHDLYHAGQIQLLKRLRPAGRRAGRRS
jgi:hypothetical protein